MHLWADVLNYLQTLRVSQVFLQLVVVIVHCVLFSLWFL